MSFADLTAEANENDGYMLGLLTALHPLALDSRHIKQLVTDTAM